MSPQDVRASVFRFSKANAVMVLYFIMPNLLSFFGVLLLAALYFMPETLNCFSTCLAGCKIGDQKDGVVPTINGKYNLFIKSEFSSQLLAVIIIGFASQLVYFLPSWFVVLMICQVYAGWELLAECGVLHRAQSILQKATATVDKFVRMIPRHD